MLFGIFVDNKMKKVGIKKVWIVKILNILDIINTAIEKLMTILVPGWLSLRIFNKFKYFFIFIPVGIFLNNYMKKWDLKGFWSQILEYSIHFQYHENWSPV